MVLRHIFHTLIFQTAQEDPVKNPMETVVFQHDYCYNAAVTVWITSSYLQASKNLPLTAAAWFPTKKKCKQCDQGKRKSEKMAMTL